PGSHALGGTTTISAASGVATFAGLNFSTPGTYTLQVSCAGLPAVTTSNIVVAAGPASQFVVVIQPPTSVMAGNAFSLQIKAEDPSGNLATDFDGLVSASIARNSDGATFVGNPTATASGGLAEFTNLIIDKAGSGLTIEIADTPDDLKGTATSPFSVTPG